MKQLCIMLLAAMVSLSTGQTADKKGVKVGMTIQDLSNPVWAGYCQALQKKIGIYGGKSNLCFL